MIAEFSINLGNLILSLSDALDLASTKLALHQQRTAFISWEIGKAAGLDESRVERLFVAALLHDIGALSVEEKLALHQNETVNTEAHCLKGELLFEDIPWLRDASKIVRHHHTSWEQWTDPIHDPLVLDSQVLAFSDIMERSIQREGYILHQADELRQKARDLSGKEVHHHVVDLFLGMSEREEFWLDLVSPRLYSLLLHHGPFRKVEIDLSSISTITRMFKNIIDFKSSFTATHSSGVAQCASTLSALFGLTEMEIDLLEVAGHLHDLGKLVVPNKILDKPGRLTKEEFDVIKQHTYFTFTILSTINGLQQVAEWAAYHHEKLDGTGYPFRKMAKELNIGARIMAVADIFTALAEDRPYRKGMDGAKIRVIMQDQSDRGLLDPNIVKILLHDMVDICKVVKEKQDEARCYFLRKFEGVSTNG